jgi:hypothetical protein
MRTRGLWSTLASIVVLAGLGAYIYFVLNKQPESSTTSSKEKVFASLQADKIEEVKVTSSAGDATTVRKENGGWQMVQPAAAKADDSEVNGITSALSSIEVNRVIDENPTSLNDYGLGNPRIEIDFKASGDKDYKKLLIGEKSPTGGDLFAKRNDEKKVFLIPAFQESTLDKKTFDLRDKTLIKFDRDKVDSIDVAAGNKSIAFAKEGSDWNIKKPLQTKADFGSVEGLVGKVQSAQMKSIAAADIGNDAKKYGLDKPQVTVDLSAGSSKATLLIGGKADENTVYARDASKPAVVTIDKTIVDDLSKGADDYRVKDLFQFRAYNANHIEITRGDQKVVFDRVKGQGDNAQDKWHRSNPNPADVDRDKVDAALAKLANMRASSFVDSTAKTGLEKPAMSVYVKFDDSKKEERASFGKAGDEVYASRNGEPGALKMDAADLSEFNKSLDEIAK